MADKERVVAIAMDGSKHSNSAFDWYVSHLRRPEDRVVLIHCPEYRDVVFSEAPHMPDIQMMTQAISEEKQKNQKLIEQLRQKLKDAGIPGKVESQGGHPGETILKVADEEKASVIMTGTRGLGTIRRTLIGSVSDFVIHHAHIPVVICRPKDHLKDHKDS